MIDAGDSWRPGPIYEKGYGVTLKLAALDQIIGWWIPDTPYLKMPRGHTLKKTANFLSVKSQPLSSLSVQRKKAFLFTLEIRLENRLQIKFCLIYHTCGSHGTVLSNHTICSQN